MIAVLNTAFQFLTNACLESTKIVKVEKRARFPLQHRFQNESLFTDKMTDVGRW